MTFERWENELRRETAKIDQPIPLNADTRNEPSCPEAPVIRALRWLDAN